MWWEHHLRGPPGLGPTIRAACVCYRVLERGRGAFGCYGKLQDSDLIQGLHGKCPKSVKSSSFVWRRSSLGSVPPPKPLNSTWNQESRPRKTGIKNSNMTHLFRTSLGCLEKRTMASCSEGSSEEPLRFFLGVPFLRVLLVSDRLSSVAV